MKERLHKRNEEKGREVWEENSHQCLKCRLGLLSLHLSPHAPFQTLSLSLCFSFPLAFCSPTYASQFLLLHLPLYTSLTLSFFFPLLSLLLSLTSVQFVSDEFQ